MTFSGLFFVLVFLPVFLIIYLLAKTVRARNAVLLIFSIIFYASAGIGYLVLIIALSFFGWYTGARIWMERNDEKRKKAYLVCGVVLLIAALGFFKYTGFVERTINDITGAGLPVLKIALPLGISFYTFKIISYLVDVCRGTVPAENSFRRFLIYTMSFHHVMQGPIVRYGDIRPQLRQRRLTRSDFADGLFRFVVGLGKKVILADYCGSQADVLLPTSSAISSQPVLSLWIGSVFFTLQMYLDFSAYTDMALGIGRMCGFTYMENFNYPYTAKSITDFWRRWHISLSQFFRDYVYIPMGGSRVAPLRHVFNLLVVWFLTGLWHGSSWNFILWGLYYFVFVGIEHAFRKKAGNPGIGRSILGHIYALLVVNFGWVLFRYTDFAQLGAAIKGMFAGSTFADQQIIYTLRSNVYFLIVAVIACTPLFKCIDNKMSAAADKGSAAEFTVTIVKTVFAAAIFIWSLFAMAGNTYTPFLYNQF